MRFSWPKWSHDTSAQTEASSRKRPEDQQSYELIQELLWHLQERKAGSLELERRLPRGYTWFHTLIPASELDQLEVLCAGIPPVCAAALLSRFHEVLAASEVMPWELVSVFKMVLRDVKQRQCDKDHNLSEKAKILPTMAFWTSSNKSEQGVVDASSSDKKSREEIPTVSGYVDRVTRYTTSFTGRIEWDLPYYYPVPTRPMESWNTKRGHSSQ
ncbi:protein RD3-like isoform X2 [Corythoichthys intestinalis]|nr:protein RD3-like isoform X2 [Corythoichthys intestinalis]XP_057715252.1 protein RD3-like isoform X2 [Corythoichthys intestinalis]XP_061798226.1 protein RD3-like [Nerophis lumbriciformis]